MGGGCGGGGGGGGAGGEVSILYIVVSLLKLSVLL